MDIRDVREPWDDANGSEPPWRKLRGAAVDSDLMNKFLGFREQERQREDPSAIVKAAVPVK